MFGMENLKPRFKEDNVELNQGVSRNKGKIEINIKINYRRMSKLDVFKVKLNLSVKKENSRQYHYLNMILC